MTPTINLYINTTEQGHWTAELQINHHRRLLQGCLTGGSTTELELVAILAGLNALKRPGLKVKIFAEPIDNHTPELSNLLSQHQVTWVYAADCDDSRLWFVFEDADGAWKSIDFPESASFDELDGFIRQWDACGPFTQREASQHIRQLT